MVVRRANLGILDKGIQRDGVPEFIDDESICTSDGFLVYEGLLRKEFALEEVDTEVDLIRYNDIDDLEKCSSSCPEGGTSPTYPQEGEDWTKYSPMMIWDVAPPSTIGQSSSYGVEVDFNVGTVTFSAIPVGSSGFSVVKTGAQTATIHTTSNASGTYIIKAKDENTIIIGNVSIGPMVWDEEPPDTIDLGVCVNISIKDNFGGVTWSLVGSGWTGFSVESTGYKTASLTAEVDATGTATVKVTDGKTTLEKEVGVTIYEGLVLRVIDANINISYYKLPDLLDDIIHPYSSFEETKSPIRTHLIGTEYKGCEVTGNYPLIKRVYSYETQLLTMESEYVSTIDSYTTTKFEYYYFEDDTWIEYYESRTGSGIITYYDYLAAYEGHEAGEYYHKLHSDGQYYYDEATSSVKWKNLDLTYTEWGNYISDLAYYSAIGTNFATTLYSYEGPSYIYVTEHYNIVNSPLGYSTTDYIIIEGKALGESFGPKVIALKGVFFVTYYGKVS